MQIYTIPPNIRTLIKKKSKKLAGIKPFAYFYPSYDDPAADDLWQMFEGAFRSWFALDNLCEEKIEAYIGDSGSKRTGQSTAAWQFLYDKNAAERDFDKQARGAGAIVYPALSDQYAVLVQGSWKPSTQR